MCCGGCTWVNIATAEWCRRRTCYILLLFWRQTVRHWLHFGPNLVFIKLLNVRRTSFFFCLYASHSDFTINNEQTFWCTCCDNFGNFLFLVCGFWIQSECVNVFCKFWIIIPKTRIQDSEKNIEVFITMDFISSFFIAFFISRSDRNGM